MGRTTASLCNSQAIAQRYKVSQESTKHVNVSILVVVIHGTHGDDCVVRHEEEGKENEVARNIKLKYVAVNFTSTSQISRVLNFGAFNSGGLIGDFNNTRIEDDSK